MLDAGAEEVNDLGESFEVISEATDLVAVRTALQDAGIDYDSADANFVPTMQVELDEEGARKIFKLIDALEDSDDVQNVFANFDVIGRGHGEGRRLTLPQRQARRGVAQAGPSTGHGYLPSGAVRVARPVGIAALSVPADSLRS